MIVMCTCGRVKAAYSGMVQGGSVVFWVRPVDRDPSQPNAISHGLCPECAEKTSRKLDEMEKNLGFDELTTEGGGA